MSASHLIIDVETLKGVASSIKSYISGAQANLETAMHGLQAAQGEWSDEDMELLQDSLQAFYSEVEEIGSKGLEICERCDKKIEAVAQLHSMQI